MMIVIVSLLQDSRRKSKFGRLFSPEVANSKRLTVPLNCLVTHLVFTVLIIVLIPGVWCLYPRTEHVRISSVNLLKLYNNYLLYSLLEPALGYFRRSCLEKRASLQHQQ
jgi:hypothetical protein